MKEKQNRGHLFSFSIVIKKHNTQNVYNFSLSVAVDISQYRFTNLNTGKEGDLNRE